MPISTLKKALPVITAALSVAIWTLFVVCMAIIFEGGYYLTTIVIALFLGLAFAVSTTWDAYREWRTKRGEK